MLSSFIDICFVIFADFVSGFMCALKRRLSSLLIGLTLIGEIKTFNIHVSTRVMNKKAPFSTSNTLIIGNSYHGQVQHSGRALLTKIQSSITQQEQRGRQLVLLKKVLIGFLASCLLMLMSTFTHSRPSYANTATPLFISRTNQRTSGVKLLSSTRNNLDKIITGYVEQRMFDDVEYDHLESAYREAYNDRVTGRNPISDFVSQKKERFALIEKLPTKVINSIVSVFEKKGMDPKLIKSLTAVLFVALAPISMFYIILGSGGFFRKVLMRQEKKRYGGVSDIYADEKEVDVNEVDEEDNNDEDNNDEESNDGDDN